MRVLVAPCLAFGALLAVTSPALALDEIDLKVVTWTSPDGRAYVGVKATAEWAAPATKTVDVVTPYYSVWDVMGLTQPFCRHYWVWVHRTADDQIVNPASPMAVVTCARNPGIGIRPEAYGDLSLYLDVSV